MRSLTPTTVVVTSLPSGRGAELAVDPENNGTVYVAVERLEDDTGVHVDIVRLQGLDNGHTIPETIASFSSPVLAPFPLPHGAPQTLNLRYFPDDRSLIVLLAGGDIAVLQLELVNPDEGVVPIEVVGSIDSGIKAAAWSPDDEQLVLVTGEDNLVCMTRSFDTIYEGPLRSDDFGDDKFINVGWGSEGTQFHGSLGKKALLAAQEQAGKPTAPKAFAHETDDGLPRITFKGDAAFFAVSSLDTYAATPEKARRQVRVYSRDASAGFAPRLSATTEELPGLEGPIAWRPVGNVIASLVRYGYSGGGEGRFGRWDVAMLERNGLRHGGFELREDETTWKGGYVHAMAWNAESDVLAIWIRRAEEDVIQLWTMKNYHYYLKQEITPPRPESRRFVSMKWHPEQPMTLYLVGEDNFQIRSFVWNTYAAHLPAPHDTASVAVVDGKRLLVTPFRTQNTPPPMSSYQLSLPATPVHVSMSPTEDALAILYGSGLVQVWDLNTRLPEAGESRLRAGAKVAEPKVRWEQTLARKEAFVSKQIALSGEGTVAGLFWGGQNGDTFLREADANGVQPEAALRGWAEWLLWDKSAGWLTVDRFGGLFSLDMDKGGFIAMCQRPQAMTVSSATGVGVVFELTEDGNLWANSFDTKFARVLASAVNSFTLTPDFVIYTTTAQRSFYVPLAAVDRILAGEPSASVCETELDERRVERGALVVVACPSSMSLVLQMPRGNLETVYPRPLVLAVVRRDILAGDYRAAFLTCRKHRLDLNILYDLAPAQFMDALPKFVQQIPEVDFLNLFVSQLNTNDSSLVLYKDLQRDVHRAPVPATKVNDICDALRALLETDLVKYVETVLTTYVCKQPPDYEAGLRVLLQVQEEHPEVVEEAIKYIIFLSNVNQLFDVALGMYDFQLVLMIAQYSQKDPKEYLPFLRELRALEHYEQRFRIDDHLGRRDSALRNLQAAGPSRFDDAASYLSRYELFDEAFRLYKDDKEHMPTIHDLYGDYLYDRREFHDAAISYVLGGQRDKALKAYEKAHAWQELFTLAREMDVPAETTAAMVERVTDYLASRGRHAEAGQVFIEYANDVDAAVDVLSRGAEFSEAQRLVSRHSRPDLVSDVIHPALEEAHEALEETLEEMDGQLDKELERLAILRKIRATDPDSFYLVDNEPDLENVDVATNATTVATAFTRYTVAPTTVFSQSTRMTGQTAKSKHKASKRQAGRKGTVDEYDYLVASIGRLVKRVDDKSAEAVPLLRHLALSPHTDLAASLQDAVLKLRAKLVRALDEAWEDRDAILDETAASGGLGLGGDVTPARALERPSVAPWKGLARLV